MDFTKSFKPSSSDMDNFPKIFRSPTLDTKKENPMAFFYRSKTVIFLHHLTTTCTSWIKLEGAIQKNLPKDTQFAIARSDRDFRTSLLALPLDPKIRLVCSIHWLLDER